MKKPSKLKGILLIVIGLAIAGKVFGILTFKLLFPGWWTLFMIIPGLIGFCNTGNSREDRGNSFFWFSIGIICLLVQLKMLTFKLAIWLVVADLFICSGIKNMLSQKEKERMKKVGKSKIKYYYGEDNLDYSINQENKLADEFERSMGINRDETVYKENPDLEVFNNVGNPSQYHEVEKRVGEYTINEQVIVEDNSTSSRMPVRDKITLTAILSGKELKLGREVFQGGSINTVLGGIEVDLREAIIREDIRVDVNVLLGGVDIRLPENVRCVVTTTDILGGVSVSKKFTKNQSEYAPTVYIGGSCVLGGIDIN